MAGRAFVYLLIVGLGLPLTSRCQQSASYDLFTLEGDELFWRYTYVHADVPRDSLRRAVVQMLKSKFFTFSVIRNEIGYNGELRHYRVDGKRYGRTYLNTPRMYWEGEWTGKFTVEVVDGQYRVTIYALYYEKIEPSTDYYKTEKVSRGRYIDAVTKKNKRVFRKNEFPNLALMSLSLKDNFDIRNTVILPEDR